MKNAKGPMPLTVFNLVERGQRRSILTSKFRAVIKGVGGAEPPHFDHRNNKWIITGARPPGNNIIIPLDRCNICLSMQGQYNNHQ